MAYVIPTPAQLKTLFPAFSAVDDAIVQDAIDAGARRVDTTWTEGDYARAIMLYACHYMTISGQVAGAGGIGGGNAAYRQIRSGQLTLTKYAKGEQAGDDGSLLGSTSYGRLYLDLLQMNKGGPIVIAGPAEPGYGWPV